MASAVARLWFIPGDGIERSVISSDIQRYLGNDATVRPGLGTDEFEGVAGYWIKAQRNLTSYQVEDLTRASARFRQEQQHGRPGSSTTYQGSVTQKAQHSRQLGRGDDSPIATDAGHAVPGRRVTQRPDPRVSDPRIADPRIPFGRGDDEMDIDYAPTHRPYDDDNRFTPERPAYHDGRPAYGEPAGYRGPPAPYGYGTDPRDRDTRDPRDQRDYRDVRDRDPRDARDPRDIRDPREMRDPRDVRDPRDMRDPREMRDPRFDPRPDMRPDPRMDGRAEPRLDQRGPQYSGAPGPGYLRPQEPGYYPPPAGAYPPSMNAPPMQPPYGNGYAPAPGQGQGQGLRDPGRDPRYGGPPAYPNDPRIDPRNPDARYAYPSPPVTVVDTRDTTPNTMPQSSYSSAPVPGSMQARYDYDGRPQPPSLVGPSPGAPGLPRFGSGTIQEGPPRGPPNAGQRPMGSNDLPEARRRRLN